MFKSAFHSLALLLVLVVLGAGGAPRLGFGLGVACEAAGHTYLTPRAQRTHAAAGWALLWFVVVGLCFPVFVVCVCGCVCGCGGWVCACDLPRACVRVSRRSIRLWEAARQGRRDDITAVVCRFDWKPAGAAAAGDSAPAAAASPAAASPAAASPAAATPATATSAADEAALEAAVATETEAGNTVELAPAVVTPAAAAAAAEPAATASPAAVEVSDVGVAVENGGDE